MPELKPSFSIDVFPNSFLFLLAKSLRALQIVRKVHSSCLRQEETFEHRKILNNKEVDEYSWTNNGVPGLDFVASQTSIRPGILAMMAISDMMIQGAFSDSLL